MIEYANQIVFDHETLDKLRWFNATLFKEDEIMIADRDYNECKDDRLLTPASLDPKIKR